MPTNLEDDAGAHAPPPQPRHWAWANLMRRAFDIDVLATAVFTAKARATAMMYRETVAQAQVLAYVDGAAPGDRRAAVEKA